MKNIPSQIQFEKQLEIIQNDNGSKGRFCIELDSKIEAEMTYVWSGNDKIIIDHTQVSDKLKGKNAGKLLVQRAVEFAREKHIKIMPLCPFAKAIFQKTPEYSDLIF